MLGAMRDVREFHFKMGFAADEKMPLTSMPYLGMIGRTTRSLSKQLANLDVNDLRIARAHLMLEELGELIIAMEAGDEVEALDGIVDLLYVVLGTAITFDWPLSTAFAEVHDSNMTKNPKRARPHHPTKGEKYRPPNFESLLNAYRRIRCTEP